MKRTSYKLLLLAGVMLTAMTLLMGAEAKPVIVANKGIGGNNTANALSRLERDVLSIKPDCLIIEFGMNDAINSYNLIEPQQFAKNINSMVEKTQSANIKNIALVTINPVVEKYVLSRHKKYPFPESPNERIKKYNDIIKNIVLDKNLILIDLNSLVADNQGATELAESLIRNRENSKSADGVHLTAMGNKLLAETAAEQLKKAIRPGYTVVCFGDSITFGANLKGAGTVTGDTYPAHLQLLLNKQFGTIAPIISAEIVSAAPISSGIASNNFMTNGSFEKSANGIMPDNWVLWKKNNDKCELISDESNIPEGKRFIRVSIGDKPDASVFVRSDIGKIASGSYQLSCSLRGSGEISIGISTYKPNAQPVYKVVGKAKLDQAWTTVKYPVEVEQGANTFSVSFSVNGKADIDNIVIEPVVTAVKPVAVSAVIIKKIEFTNTVSLNNNLMALTLAPPEQGGGIISIKNSAGKEFINRNTSGELWKIKFKQIKPDISGLPPIINLSIDPEKDDGTNDKSNGVESGELAVSSKDISIKCQKIEKPGYIKFIWSGMSVGKEEKCLDVWVSFTLNDDSFCRINSGFENRSKEYTVFYFIAPAVEGIGAVDGNMQKDYLATPSYNGRLICNPISNGLLGKNRIFQPNRSGHSMQFDAYYNSGNGLYLGCFDREQFVKRYQIESDSDRGISWSLVNVPNNMRQIPQQWEVPYPAVLRCFAGDWYDACQIYRTWALKQSWSAEGPLLTRKSIPQWFKEIDEWLSISESGFFASIAEFNQMKQDFAKYKLGVMCYGWGVGHHFDEMNPERFPLDSKDLEYLKQMSQNNIAVMGYIQCTGWADITKSFLNENGAQNTVKTYSGQALKWPRPSSRKTNSTGNEVIAYPGKAWTKVLGDSVEEMAKAGFAAAYLDSGNHGGTYLNFTPNCSRDSGGGNGYIKGNQQLIETIKQRARKINPDFCFTAESFWEGNIAVLDGILACNTTNIYLEGSRVTAIPMAQTVYHDYCLMYSVWPSRWDVERDSARGYIAKHGLAFIWGVKPGWNILSLLYKYQNHEIALATSLKRYEAYSKSKKFLVYGQMLRAPEVISKNELLPVKWHISYSEKYYNVDMPTILCSAWRSPEGKLGIVLYNISDKTEQVKVKLNRKEYGMADGDNVFNAIYPNGDQIKAVNAQDSEILTVAVPASSPAVYELK